MAHRRERRIVATYQTDEEREAIFSFLMNDLMARCLPDRGCRQFDGFFNRAPQGEDWTITPDRRSSNARMDDVWLDFPELSHAREPLTENRRYTDDIA